MTPYSPPRGDGPSRTYAGTQFPSVNANQTCARLSHEASINFSTTGLRRTRPLDKVAICAAWALLVQHYTGESQARFGIFLDGNDFAYQPFWIDCRDENIDEFFSQVSAKLIDVVSPCHGHTAEEEPDSLVSTVLALHDQHGAVDLDMAQFVHTAGLRGAVLAIECYPDLDSVVLNARFDPNNVGPSQLDRVLGHLVHVLSNLICVEDVASIKGVQGCTTIDRLRFEELNSGITGPADKCFHEMFSRMASLRPHALAIYAWDGIVTYKELELTAENLSHSLRRRGVHAESVVPLYFEKSKWAVIAMLAVAKAGGAFVSLDSSAPPARNNSILDHTTVNFVLTSRQLDRLPGLKNLEWVPADSAITSSASSVGQLDASSSNLLYIIFTSGSTGPPKAVAITHTAFCSSAINHSEALSMNQDSRVLQFSSFTFDGCILEILTTLSVGGCVCVPSESERINDLAGTIERMRVNWAVLTPTVARLLDPQAVPTLATLVLAGEALQMRDLSRWAAKTDQKQIFTGYGPSECAILSTVAIVDPWNPVPQCLGLPTGCALWIVDQRDADVLLPYGAEGELLIEGANVGRGYLAMPERSALSWIAPPAWASSQLRDLPESRFYLSGDICKYAEDGTVHFVRRKDTQVKLRGQRLSMFEVEMHLKEALPSFDVAAEVVRFESEDVDRSILVAFAAPLDTPSDTALAATGRAQELLLNEGRRRLMDLLPSYMVPTTVILLEKIPLTSSGKADRVCLRNLAKQRHDQQLAISQQNITPNVRITRIEGQLRALWAHVLGLPESSVSLHDHFFQSGADSVTAMRLVSMAQFQGLQFSVADIFRRPILADFAASLEKAEPDVAAPMDVSTSIPFSLLVQEESILPTIRQQGSLVTSSIEDVLPCTALQEGLMLLSIRNAGSYIGQESYELPVHVDVDAFKAAWATVYASTAIWRTRLVHLYEHGIFQVVMKEPIVWDHASSIEDLRSKRMGFGDRLAFFGLVPNVSTRRTQFVFTAHHSLYDAWTMALTFEAVHQAYHGQQLPRLLSMSSIYARLTTETRDSTAYWAEYLNGFNARPFPGLKGSHESLRLDKSVEMTMKCQSLDASKWTLFTLMKAAWAILVNQYTGCEDVVFATPISGRNADIPDIDRVCAPTLATVPVRARLRKSGHIKDLLEQLQTDAVNMIPFQQTGIQHIQRINESTRLACQFGCLLLLQDGSASSYDYSDVFGPRRLAEDAARTNSYPLTLDITPVEGGFNVLVGFDSAALSEIEAERIVHQFIHILDRLAIVDVSKPVEEVQTVQKQEIGLIESWNLQGNCPAMEQCVHEAFREVSAVHPDRVAISSWDMGDITFQRLDRLSDLLATTLVAQGVGPDILVPLVFEKSMWSIVAMLGVLKAGGGFVCLDPHSPKERTAKVCSQVQPHIALTSEMHRGHLVDIVPTCFVVGANTTTAPQFASHAPCHEDIPCNPHNIMYVVFTSGSTGQPKGCVIEHRAYLTAARAVALAHGVHSATRSFQFCNYTFDVSIEDIFTTIISGGCVCVASQYELDNDLSGSMHRYAATHVELTPTVANIVKFEKIPSLRTVVIAGESASKLHISKRDGAHIRFINSYGLSETSITNVVAQNMQSCDVNDIGSPVACSAWIVDTSNHNKLIPIGAEGELLISGAVLARGYLQLQSKTAEAFTSAPAWVSRLTNQFTGNERFYKTGDLVRYSKNGSIIHLGRKDQQIKLYGLRIELGEIEHHVERLFPHLSSLVETVPHSGDETITNLVVFLVHNKQDRSVVRKGFSDESTRTISRTPVLVHNTATDVIHAELRRQLLCVLPQYMVPRFYITIDEMPLTAAGKVDRPKLKEVLKCLSPTMLAGLEQADYSVQPPVTANELQMQSFWAAVLGIEPKQIGTRSHFFRLGGDSLHVMRLVSLLRERNIKGNVSDVYQNPILAELALQCSDLISAGTTQVKAFQLVSNAAGKVRGLSTRLGLEPDIVQDMYPCTALQEGMVSLSSRYEGTYIGRAIYKLPASLDLPRWKGAWERFIANTAIWRTVICEDTEGSLMQVVLNQAPTWHTAYSLDAFLCTDKMDPMRPDQALSRLTVIDERSTGGSIYAGFTLHHAAHDAWSFSLAMRVVSQLYRTNVLYTTVEFNTFIQYTLLVSRNDSKRYWGSYLDGYSGPMFPDSPRNDRHKMSLSEIQHSFAHRASPTALCTPTILLRAAWAALVFSYTGQQDVVFGTTLSGRNANIQGIEKCLGPTLTTVPCRIRIEPEQTVGGLLRYAQSSATEMIPYEQYGLQNIAIVSRSAGIACLFSSLVVYQTSTDLPASDDSMGTEILEEDNSAYTSQALLVECRTTPEVVTYKLTFEDTVISPAAASRILEQLEHVFLFLRLSDGSDLLSSLRQCSPRDFLQMATWNAGTMADPSQSRVHDLIYKAVSATPDALAVDAWDGQLTYRELFASASGLARQLGDLGIGHGSIVPLWFERSKYHVLAMLAVSITGAAFVSIDPSTPGGRADHLVARVAARTLLTSSHTTKFPGPCVIQCLFVDQMLDPAASLDPERISRGLECLAVSRQENEDTLLCILFTSGSTGEPKGVMLSHQNFCSIAPDHCKAANVKPDSRTLNFSSPTFDATLFELLTTLVAGGCCCIPSEIERTSDLLSFMSRLRVNLAILTPSVARLFQRRHPRSLQTLILAGEPVTPSDLEMHEEVADVRICYGPTETTIATNFAFGETLQPFALGTAVGCAVWVVDPTNPNILLPIGSTGELLIQGPNVSTFGYLSNPEQSQAVFLASPTWAKSAAKRTGSFYLTGDLVNQQGDGSLQYFGRKDDQVKLRGQRVELGEVEAQLRSVIHDGEVAVQVVKMKNETPTLVAFLCRSAQGHHEAEVIQVKLGTSTDVIRVLSFASMADSLPSVIQNLAHALPGYMIPSLFIPLSRLPLTVSGKTDKKALQLIALNLKNDELDDLTSKPCQDGRLVQTPSEKTLQIAWSKILRLTLDEIKASDDFVSLGGNSLSAMHLVANIRETGSILSVVDVFEAPVLFNLALRLRPLPTARDKPDHLCSGTFAAEPRVIAECAAALQVDESRVQDVYPCTPLQQGLMSLSVRDGSYVGREVLTLNPSIDCDRFMQAWEDVVAALAIWRTRILHSRSGSMLQVVLGGKIDWQHIEVEHLGQYLHEAPLPRIGLLESLSEFTIVREVSTGKTHLFLALHHAMHDSLSLQDTFLKVSNAYRGEALGPIVPFRDFIDHLQLPASRDGASHTFWKSYFEDTDTIPFPLSATPTTGTRVSQTLRARLDCNLNSCKSFTAFTVLEAAWAILTSQYTACNDVVFGTTLNGRNAAVDGIEYVAGPTITTVPVRVQVQPDQSIFHLLQHVQRGTAAMVPFEQTGIQHIQNIDSNTALGCRFNTLIVFQGDGAEQGRADIFQRSALVVHDDEQYNSYGLTLEVTSVGSGLDLVACYDECALSELQMARILSHLQSVIVQLTSMAGTSKLRNLRQISTGDERQIKRWNTRAPVASHLRGACIQEVFNLVAMKRPSATAVHAWDGELSFQRLDELSSALSMSLIEAHVGAESVVPLCFEKSAWSVVAMLAVLKAGGAFVNIDPKDPSQRVDNICKQTCATVALTSCTQRDRFASMGLMAIVANDETCRGQFGRARSALVQSISPKGLAYIIFTSGSTGNPKGVCMEHAAFVTNALQLGPELGVTSSTRALHFAANTFDTSIEEVWTTLLHGGCVCIPSDSERIDNLTKSISDYGVTFADLTPSVAALVDYSATPSLRVLVLGGELATSCMEECMQHSILVKNSYGLTEAAVTNTIASSIATHGPSNIGRAVGCTTWVVDPSDHDALAPIGGIGELLIGGDCLARCYLNEPAMTAESFVDNPRWSLAAWEGPQTRRFYKTGDLVRYEEDGTLIYLRRKDTQVKLRGLRIELSEVEIKISSLAPGSHVVVEIIDGVGTGPKRQMLMAFMAKNDTADGSASMVDRFRDPAILPPAEAFETRSLLEKNLQTFLPSYMVPTIWLFLSHIPLNASGKADRKRLRSLATTMPSILVTELLEHQSMKTPPQSQLEVQMQTLWARTLGVGSDAIGRDDHFFHHGGDSIRAMQLVSLARATAMSLTVAQVFSSPVLRDLCETLQRSDRVVGKHAGPSRNGIVSSRRDAILDLLPHRDVQTVVGATAFQTMAVREHSKPNAGFMTYITFKFGRKVDRLSLRNAYQHAVEQTEVLRTIFVEHDHHTYQVVLREFSAPFLESATAPDSSSTSNLLICEDQKTAIQPFEPLLKSWFINGREKDAFVMRLSHAQYDGLSLPFIFQDLQGIIRDHPADYQMPAYVASLRSLPQEPAVVYWRDLLKGSDQKSLSVGVPLAGQKLDVSSVECTMHFTRPSGSVFTSATYLKAAWALVLARSSGSDDIVFGHLISGRSLNLEGVENVKGPCINLVPVRINTALSPRLVLRAVHQQQIDSMQFEHVGFDTVLKECTNWTPRYDHELPRFNSILQYQNLPDFDETFTMHGAECSITYDATPADVTDVWVIVEPRGSELHISARFFKQVLGTAVVESLIKDLCQTLRSLGEWAS